MAVMILAVVGVVMVGAVTVVVAVVVFLESSKDVAVVVIVPMDSPPLAGSTWRNISRRSGKTRTSKMWSNSLRNR